MSGYDKSKWTPAEHAICNAIDLLEVEMKSIGRAGDRLNRLYDRASDGSKGKHEVKEEMARLGDRRTSVEERIEALIDSWEALNEQLGVIMSPDGVTEAEGSRQS